MDLEYYMCLEVQVHTSFYDFLNLGVKLDFCTTAEHMCVAMLLSSGPGTSGMGGKQIKINKILPS